MAILTGTSHLLASSYAGGFEQKASNETRNLPADAEDRIGEFAPHGVKKYYLFDGDAAMD